MVSIPGINYANPNVFSEGEVVSSGVSIASADRIQCILGLNFLEMQRFRYKRVF